MPETEQTGPLDAGTTTSEYQVTKLASYLSIAAAVVGSLLVVLGDLTTAFPSVKWLGIALAVVGVLGKVLTAVGYQVTRANVKVAAIKASATPVASPDTAAARIGQQ